MANISSKTRMKHVALFSQSGAELMNIATFFDHTPDLVITNNRPNSSRRFDSRVIKLADSEGCLDILSNKPSLGEYKDALSQFDPQNTLITLHGWLRVIPPDLCEEWTIFNGHPGDIVNYPDLLKGKDPQQKAFDLKLVNSGCVIHEVVAEVDEGKVHSFELVSIQNKSREEIYVDLARVSLKLWGTFLQKWLNFQ
jgi:folate-dependent phosphoribosylglycinamide formyltransferase PurN